MAAVLEVMREAAAAVPDASEQAINCHHNYVARERHFGAPSG